MIERTTLQLGPHKPIRSFVERQGRISLQHRLLVSELWLKFGLTLTNNQLNTAQIFGRSAPVTLEIGFGDGRSLLAQAQSNPQHDFIGIEVYKAGIAKLLLGLDKHKVSNVRIFCADALEVLTNCVVADSLAQVQLFFPDPWPKARHHKRRLVQTEFVNLIANKLHPEGVFHVATDWQDYALHVLDVMATQDNWVNAAGQQKYVVRPSTRPVTKYEQRGQRLGNEIYDLIFRKNANI